MALIVSPSAAVLTQEQVREHLSYNSVTGSFTRLTRNHYRWPIGSEAGVVDESTGYVRVGLLGARVWAHRLAFLYVEGQWPSEEVDHRNGDRSDNRWANLRRCSKSENVQNSAKRKDNTSGFVGVRLDRRRGKYYATFRDKFFGSFDSAESAYATYLVAKSQQHSFQPVPRDLCHS